MERRLLGLAAAMALLAGKTLLVGQAEAEPPLQWWKGNLHTHSLWSDGDDFPEMIARWYREHGYHFLALSDHNTLSAGERWMLRKEVNRRAGVDAVGRYVRTYGPHWVQLRGSEAEGNQEVRLKTYEETRAMVEMAGRFLLVQSEELTGAAGNGRTLHMNATNLGEQLAFRAGATIPDSILANLQQVEESAKRTGREVMVHVNHPNYKWGLTAQDLAAILPERFFEVWNGVDGDNDPGDAEHPSTEQMWEMANAIRMQRWQGQPLYGLATDDTHNHHGNKSHSPPGRAWVMVRARHLTPESLVRAMRAGDFYASTGVVLEDVAYEAKSRRLQLRVQAAGSESFTTRFVGVRKGGERQEVFAESKGLTPAYGLRGDELYVRAVVESTGAPEVPSEEYPRKRAWTQPVGW